MPWGPVVSSKVATEVQAEGALSRRHPGEPQHSCADVPVMTGSLKVSQRTEVSSTPQPPPPAPCFMPCPPGPLTGAAMNVPSQPPGCQKGAAAAGCPGGPAAPGADHNSSLGDFNSFDTSPPCDE